MIATARRSRPDAGRSWWLRDALADDSRRTRSSAPGDTTADVVILGGGYTGMWTALHLTRLDPGVDIVILEQDIAGGGASGRNGGFVNSFWGDVEYLARRFGDRAAIALCEAGEESVRGIGAFCENNGIDAWYRADGEYVVGRLRRSGRPLGRRGRSPPTGSASTSTSGPIGGGDALAHLLAGVPRGAVPEGGRDGASRAPRARDAPRPVGTGRAALRGHPGHPFRRGRPRPRRDAAAPSGPAPPSSP